MTPNSQHIAWPMEGPNDGVGSLNKRVAIFDLDGTLVDSIDGMTEAVNRLLRQRKSRPLSVAEVAPLLGHGLQRLIQKACALRAVQVSDYDIDQAIESYASQPLFGTRLFPGIANMLALLAQADWRLIVCTNKSEAIAIAILEGLGILAYFDLVCGGDTVERRKPAPEHLWSSLQRAGLEGAPAVMIGDTMVDVEAATAAGFPCIFACWGYGLAPGDDRECLRAATVTDVPALLSQAQEEHLQGLQT